MRGGGYRGGAVDRYCQVESEERLYEEPRNPVEDPGLFMFYENWESRPLWEQHMESPHLQEFSGKQEELTETWELFVGEKV